MKHLGDITKIDGAAVEPVEVIIGGSPCQDLSVAGKREGLSGERSGLFMEQIRIIKEMREHGRQNGATYIRPRYMVWENVPGAFSSNKGEDFRIVLEETARVVEPSAVIPRPPCKWTNAGTIMGDGWSIAWRVADNQFWGTPQRRRRIALIADFGGATAPEILFERKGVSGNTQESGTPWKEFAAAIAKRFGGASQERRTVNTTYCIQGNCIDRSDTAGCNGKGWTEDKCFTLNTIDRPAVCNVGILDNQGGQIIHADDNACISPTLRAEQHGHVPCVYDTICVRERSGCEGGGKGLLVQDNKSGTITANNDQFVVYDTRGNENGKVAPALTGDHNNRVTDYTGIVCMATQQGVAEIRTDDKAPTITAAAGMSGNNQPVIVYNEEQITDPTNKSNPKVGNPCHTLGATGANRAILCCGFKTQSGAKAKGIGYEEDKAPTLSSQRNDTAVIAIDRAAYNQKKNAQYDIGIDESGICQSLVAKGPGAIMSKAVVRRLTPIEGERLQGFPDNWTNIGDWIDSKGKKRKSSDASRNHGIGNSIGLPFWAWLLERIIPHTDGTMASLFDGIGGFPLIWETLGGKCLWASEIEEFPIAVTKYHFGENI